jgi:hypothetical protein
MKFKINGKSAADKRVIFDKMNSLQNAEYVIEITQVRPKRSLNQLNYYFACIVEPIADFCGYNKEEMHEILKAKFLTTGTMLPDGTFVIYGGSTGELDTKSMEEYLEKVRIWAATDLGLTLSLPHEAVPLQPQTATA